MTLTQSGQAQEQAEREQVEANRQSEEAEQFSVPVSIVESQAESEARQRSEAEASQREVDDLIAQQGMNAATQAMQRATEDMRQYSYVQTWLIGAGTALLVGTLILTVAANNSARAAVTVTREIGQAQTRAYLEIDYVQYGFGQDPKPVFHPTSGIQAEVHIRNFGNSPAKRIRLKRKEKTVGRALLTTFDDGLKSAETMEDFSLGSGSAFMYKIDNIVTVDEYIGITEFDAFTIISAQLNYLDIFGKERETVFNLRIENFGTDRVRIFPYGKRNYST